MADLVRVPYTELIQRASRIRQEVESIRAEIATLKETIVSIEWMGKRADRFFSLWEETVMDMERWAGILDGFATELEAQGQRMQAVDEAL